MRSLPILLVVVALAAIAGLIFLVGGSNGGDPVTPVVVDSEGDPADTELPIQTGGADPDAGGQRTSIQDPEENAESTSGGELPDLAKIDANALHGRVVDAGGVGIAGCVVVFLEGGSGAFTWKGVAALSKETAPRTTTGGDGAFRFENLPPGESHALVVHHPEIALKITEGVLVGDQGEFEEPPIVLRYGKRIRGRVVNEFGLPLEGVDIHVDGRWIPADPQPSVDRLSTVTDAEGKYEIFGVPDGTRCLTAEAPGYSRLTRIQSLILNDMTGDSHIVDLTLQAQARMAGRVTDVDGNGIGGVEVLAVDRAAYRDVSHGRGVSGPDGAFLIEGLASATYLVSIDSPLFGKIEKPGVETPIDNLNLILQERPAWSGRVVDAESQAPVVNYDLRLRHHMTGENQPSLPKGDWIEVRGSADGSFLVPSPEAGGVWQVEARGEGFAPGLSASFTFEPYTGVDGILVEVREGGALRGRLVDSDGEPVTGGRIASRDDAWTDDAFSAIVGDEEGRLGTERTGRSAVDGTFLLPNLRPGTYQLLMRSASLHQVTLTGLEVVEGEALDVGDVVLAAGASLSGVLFDAESAPVTGGMVFLAPKGQAGGVPVRRCKSGFDGGFRFVNVVPGSYLLSAKPPQPAGALLSLWPDRGGDEVVLVGGEEDQRAVHLADWTTPKPPPPKPPAGNVGGKLLTTSGPAPVGSVVVLEPKDREGDPILSKTSRGGEWAIVGVPPGEYSLLAQDHEETRVSITVMADRWTRHDLTIDS